MIYYNLLESLIYLMLCTRLDIAFAVGVLSKFSRNTKKGNRQAARHLLTYINKIVLLSLDFGQVQSTSLYPILLSNTDYISQRLPCVRYRAVAS